MQDEGVVWAPDGNHFAVVSGDSSSVFNVYIFDRAGTWVGGAPGWEAAWASDNTLIVLPFDLTSKDGFLTAYVASIGYNDVSTMEALPGRYDELLGSGHGTVILQSAQGYAVWLDGSLRPEVKIGGDPLAVSSDGSIMAVEDASVLGVVKTDSGQVTRLWPGLQTGGHSTAAFSPDGGHLALSDVDGGLNTLVVLNVSDGQRTNLLAGHFVYGGTWVSNDQILAGNDAGDWWLLSLDGTASRLTDLPSWSSYGVTSSTGSVAAVDEARTALLIARSGKIRAVSLPSAALGTHWSPDGKELVVGCESGAVVLVRP